VHICVNCKEVIPAGEEKIWGKQYKCYSCHRYYNAAKTAKSRAKKRPDGWQPKVTRHSQLNCEAGAHTCTGCAETKSYDTFPKNKETPCGYDPRCKDCRHEARRLRMGAKLNKPRAQSETERTFRRTDTARRALLHNTYNITVDMYQWLNLRQGFVCFLCKEHETALSTMGKLQHLVVDHDHRCCKSRGSCGKCIRGLLCRKCNTVLGVVESKPQLISRFKDYIDLRPLENYPGPVWDSGAFKIKFTGGSMLEFAP
jgi:hypothetical protein